MLHHEGSRLRSVTLKVVLFGAALACQPGFGAAEDAVDRMKLPRLTVAEVDWTAAFAALDAIPELHRSVATNTQAPQSDVSTVPQPLARLNAVMTSRFPGVGSSPVPVLLPFDVEVLLRDLAAGSATDDSARYMSGFRASKFFHPGPSGYDAAFTLQVADVAEFSDITYAQPIEVLISGSALLYELDAQVAVAGLPVPSLEADFPGIKRLMHENHLRYTFVRYGAPYVVSVACFDARVPRYRMPTCRAAERVVLRLLGALRIAGGTPKAHRTIEPLPLERPAATSPEFSYRSPGKLLSGTDFRNQGGRADYTVYSQIRFPLANVPAYANTQMHARRNPTPNYGYPWRDNFCERRGFSVGQCPAGIGHQGQDIRPAQCSPQPCRPHDYLVAVRDGAILRSTRQEAAYLFVNTPTEHIRFRYLHMSPRQMDADNLLSGRLVREGEVIGEISNFSLRENGTSYHLHFDVQVPTREGWVFVNPYMTLVAAYERLIAARGMELDDATVAALGIPDKTVVAEKPTKRSKLKAAKHSRYAHRGAHKTKHIRKHRVARR